MIVDKPETMEDVLAGCYELYQMRSDHKKAGEYLDAALAAHPELRQRLKEQHGRFATVISARGYDACYVTSAMYKMLQHLFENLPPVQQQGRWLITPSMQEDPRQ